MADTKWADVAHYYQKSGIILQRNRRPELVCRFLYAKGFLLYGISETIGDIIWPFDECTPILRHRDDITEAEARELYKTIWLGLMEWDENSVGPMHGSCLENWWNRESTTTKPEKWTWGDDMIGNSRVWHYLIQKGFDLFGLIESGQAIRKEAGNGL